MTDAKTSEDFETLLNRAVEGLFSDQSALRDIAKENRVFDDAFQVIALQDQQENLAIKRQCKEKREYLSKWLLRVAVGWLVFFGIVIILIGCGVLQFSDYSIITFIAGSLAEVFGLWKIALQYFFSDK